MPWCGQNEAPGVRHRGLSGGAGNRTRVREGSPQPSFTCVATVSPVAEFADSAATYLSRISTRLSRAPSPNPVLVMMPFPYQDNLRVGQSFTAYAARATDALSFAIITAQHLRRLDTTARKPRFTLHVESPSPPRDLGRARKAPTPSRRGT